MKPAPKGVQGVRLSAEEVEAVKKIAEALEVSEHAVRHFAIQRLIAEWARGWRPKRTKKVVKVLEP
jgi:hypothetical protein